MQKENVNLHAEENEDWEASTVEPAAKAARRMEMDDVQ